MATTKVTTGGITDATIATVDIADEAVTLAKLPHGTGSNDGKFLRANNGADPSFETVSIPAGTTINNNADNRVITGSGYANTLNGESKVVINSNNNMGIGTASPNVLGADGQSTILSVIETDGNRRGQIEIGDNQNVDQGGIGDIHFVGHYQNSGHKDMAAIRGVSEGSTSGQRGARLLFETKTDGTAAIAERMRIDSSGKLLIGTTTSAAGQLVVKDTAGNQIWTVGRSSDGNASISFRNNADDAYNGRIAADDSDGMDFEVAGSSKMLIDRSGKVFVSGTANLDSSKFNIFGTKAYSSGIPQQQLAVADNQAYSVTDNGGAIILLARYNSSGAHTTMGSIEGVKQNNTDGNYSGDLVFKTRSHNSDNIVRMRLNDSGLCFGTDTAAANALDDYEEGTWTPTFINLDDSSKGTINYASYRKIGGLVHVDVKVFISSSVSDTSGIGLTMPFTKASVSGGSETVFPAMTSKGNISVFLRMLDAQSSAYGREVIDDTSVTYNELAGDEVFITGTYQAA